MAPVTFETAAAFRRWLARHHAGANEIVLALAKKDSGLTSLTYRQALDEALCFGWIDGVAHRMDAATFAVRFTPRRPRSHWSAVNLRRYVELEAAGRIAPPGRARFEARERTARRYSFERKAVHFPRAFTERFKASPEAWEFFSGQPPGYRRTAMVWVMSAVRPETRARRLETLIGDSASGRRLWMVAPGRPASERRSRRS